MRLPPKRVNGKWVASSKPQALRMVVNARDRLNMYITGIDKTCICDSGPI